MVDFKPIILVGAARSGTKLVRDIIAAHPLIDKVPYDINYIWRLGNENVAHDELDIATLTPEVEARIRKQIEGYHKDAPYLIEKTVSNCLRVPYIAAVFPQAKFIHLIRNGLDVIESAHRQWLSPPDWRYIVRKARTFPITSALGYAMSYGQSAVRKWLPGGQHRASGTWGPRYRGIDDDMRLKSVLEVCAIQWACCVRKASDDLDRLPSDSVLTIFYEAFVDNPSAQLDRVSEFLDVDAEHFVEVVRRTNVTEENVGKGAVQLTPDELKQIMPYVKHELRRFRYA